MSDMIESGTTRSSAQSATEDSAERVPHVLSAVYPSRDEADGVHQVLEEQGIPARDIRIFHEAPSRRSGTGQSNP